MLRAVHTARRRLACHSSASAPAAAAAAAAESAASGCLPPPLSPPPLPPPRSRIAKSHTQHNAPPCRPQDEFLVLTVAAVNTAGNTSCSSSSSSSSIVGGDGNVSSSNCVDLQSASHSSGSPKSNVGIRDLLGDISSSRSSSSLSSRSRSRSRSSSSSGGSSDAAPSRCSHATRAAGPHLAAPATSFMHAHSHAHAANHPVLPPDELALAVQGGACLGGGVPVEAFSVGLVPAAMLTLVPSVAATSAVLHFPRWHHDAILPSCLVRGYSAQATTPTWAAAAAGAEAAIAGSSAAGAADEAPSPPDSINDSSSDSGGDGSSSSSSSNNKQGILVELGILPPPDLEAEALKDRPEEITAWARPGSGKQWAKRERAAGRVPAVLFSAEDGHLGGRKRLISVDERQMRRLLLKYGRSRFMSRTFDLRVEDDRRGAGAAAAAATAEAEEEGGGEGSEKSAVTVERVIPKAVHEHLSSDALLNVTFMRLPTQPGARVKVEIPLQFIGEDACPGIRKGGWLFCMRRTVPYECPADTIPHSIEVDLSRLGVGGKVLLADLNVPSSLRLLVRNPNLPVCKIAGSRSLENAAAAGGD